MMELIIWKVHLLPLLIKQMVVQQQYRVMVLLPEIIYQLHCPLEHILFLQANLDMLIPLRLKHLP